MGRWRDRAHAPHDNGGASDRIEEPELAQEAPGGLKRGTIPGVGKRGSPAMWEGRMTRGEDGAELSVIGRGAKVEGTLVAAGSLKIEGEVKGGITAKGDVSLAAEGRVDGNIQAKSVLLAGQVKGDVAVDGNISLPANSRVEGNIQGQNVEVGGVVKGNIQAAGKVQLGPKAHVEGDVASDRLSIEEGAVFSGRSIMGKDKARPVPEVAAVPADEPALPEGSNTTVAKLQSKA